MNGYKEVTLCHCYAGDHRVTANGSYGFKRIPKCPTHKAAMQVLQIATVRQDAESKDCELA